MCVGGGVRVVVVVPTTTQLCVLLMDRQVRSRDPLPYRPQQQAGFTPVVDGKRIRTAIGLKMFENGSGSQTPPLVTFRICSASASYG